jgi:hypothetical protein
VFNLGLSLHAQKKCREAMPVLRRAAAIYPEIVPMRTRRVEHIQAMLKDTLPCL